MKLSWLTWVFIIGVVAVVFFAFNNEGGKNAVPLDELFPEEETFPVDVEYEYIDTKPVNGALERVSKSGEAVAVVEKQVAAVASPVVVTPVASPAVISLDYEFTIQVASFKERAKADQFLQKMKTQGYDPFIDTKDLADKGIWHRVYTGRFSNKAEAETYLKKVKGDYPGGFLISPKK